MFNKSKVLEKIRKKRKKLPKIINSENIMNSEIKTKKRVKPDSTGSKESFDYFKQPRKFRIRNSKSSNILKNSYFKMKNSKTSMENVVYKQFLKSNSIHKMKTPSQKIKQSESFSKCLISFLQKTQKKKKSP
jgi:hypothetical protein